MLLSTSIRFKENYRKSDQNLTRQKLLLFSKKIFFELQKVKMVKIVLKATRKINI